MQAKYGYANFKTESTDGISRLGKHGILEWRILSKSHTSHSVSMSVTNCRDQTVENKQNEKATTTTAA